MRQESVSLILMWMAGYYADQDAPPVVDVVQSLVDKSLLRPTTGPAGERRLTYYEMIREYARDKLEQRGERAAIVARHCDHYFALAKSVRDGLKGHDQSQAIERAEY